MEYKLDKQLKYLLNTHDMNAAILSRKSGISSKTIYQWLHGQRPRDVMQICKIARIFNVSLDFIILGDGRGSSEVPMAQVILKGKTNLGQEILLFPKKLTIDL